MTPAADALAGLHAHRVHRRGQDPRRLPHRERARRHRDQRDAGHHAARGRLRPPRRARRIHRGAAARVRRAGPRRSRPAYVAAQRSRGAASRASSPPWPCAARARSPTGCARWRAALHEELGGPGVGVVGMCFTGGFALAMMVDDAVLAPVLSQPSLPFAVTRAHRRDLGISDDDLARVKERVDDGAKMLRCARALRFTGDRLVPARTVPAPARGAGRRGRRRWRSTRRPATPGASSAPRTPCSPRSWWPTTPITRRVTRSTRCSTCSARVCGPPGP